MTRSSSGIQRWRELSVDIRAAAERCIREALITISDSTIHKLELQALLENRVMKRPLSSLSHDGRQRMNEFIDEYVEKEVLSESPAYPAMRYAEGSVPDSNELRRKLGSGHNVRVFAARIAAALAEYLDPAHRQAMVDLIIDRRYWFNDEFTGLFMAEALVPHRTFDQGNSKVFRVIGDILQDVKDRIRRSEVLVLPASAGAMSEADSATTPHVAVADIAAGFAGQMYRSSDGIRRVVESFRMVVLNGAVVRL